MNYDETSRWFVTRGEFLQALKKLNGRLQTMADSQQENQAAIDAEAAKGQALDQKLVNVQQEIDAIKAQPGAQSLDFSKLDAALASDDAQADVDVADAAPTAPAPPAPPAA
jgi:septation ring formation regulator EzrA